MKFLILDRSVDVITPVIHDYNYQALAFDVLDIKNNEYRYHSEDKNTGKKSFKIGKITEDDPLWNKYKYEHISKAQQEIGESMKRLAQSQ